jgi:predicted RNA-binding protein with PIN domain
VTAPHRTPPGLPEGVRRDLVELAAATLENLPEPEVSPALRRVRSFAPTRRARAGAGPLAVALEREPGFRQAVAATWRMVHPELAVAVDAGRLPELADPRTLAVGVYLLRPEGWERFRDDLLTELRSGAAHRRQEERERVDETRLRAAVTEADQARAAAAEARQDAEALRQEIVSLRREIRRLRSDADRARAEARAALTEAAERTAAATAREEVLADTLGEAEARVREADEEVERIRRAEREGRSWGEARARLLLDTIIEAASGLRRELALPPVSVMPADLVTETGSGPVPQGTVPLRAHAAEDPAGLDLLLGLPRVHLVVDGYNVTKEGYGTLPLVEQRRRLVDGLAALVARTGAEVTCCFDGAEAAGRSASRVRGVRVVFSEPGQIADELILRLVRAEPPGRSVVVVSSDGEVVNGSRTAGARTASATALLRLLARG